MFVVNGLILIDFDMEIVGIYHDPQIALMDMEPTDLALPATVLCDANGAVIDGLDETLALLN